MGIILQLLLTIFSLPLIRNLSYTDECLGDQEYDQFPRVLHEMAYVHSYIIPHFFDLNPMPTKIQLTVQYPEEFKLDDHLKIKIGPRTFDYRDALIYEDYYQLIHNVHTQSYIGEKLRINTFYVRTTKTDMLGQVKLTMVDMSDPMNQSVIMCRYFQPSFAPSDLQNFDSFPVPTSKTWEKTSQTFKFTPSFEIPINGIIEIRFPILNPNADEIDQIYPVNHFTTAEGINNMDSDCTVDYLGEGIIRILNGFKHTSILNQEIEFQVHNVKNPHSKQNFQNIHVLTKDPLKGYFQHAQFNITVNYPSEPTNINIISSDPRSSQRTDLTFQILPNGFLNVESGVEIVFPSQFKNIDPSEITIEGIQNIKTGNLPFVFSEQKFTILNITDRYIEGQTIQLLIKNIQNPPKVLTTSSFKIKLIDGDGFDTEYQQQGLIYTTKPNTIDEIQLTLSNNKVQEASNYKFDFNISTPLNAKGVFKIQFSEYIQVPNMTKQDCNFVISNLNQYAQCSCSNNEFLIENAFLDIVASGHAVNFEIILNPQVTGLDNYAIIYTYVDDSGNLIEKDESIVIPISVLSGDIIIHQFKVNHFITGFQTAYILQFDLSHDLYPNGIIRIQFPDYIDFSRPKFSDISCSNTYNDFFNCQILPQNIVLEQINSLVFMKQTLITLQIIGLFTPRHVQTISDVIIKSEQQVGGQLGIIDQNNNNPTIDINTPLNQNNITVSVENSIVNEIGQYTFSFEAQNLLIPQDYCIVEIPADLVVSDDVECISLEGLVSNPQCDKLSENSFKLIINSNIQINQLVSFQVNNIHNPLTNKNYSPFNYIFNTEIDQKIMFGYDNIGVSSYDPAQISKFQAKIDNPIIEEKGFQTFIINNKLKIKENSSIIIGFPIDFILEDLDSRIISGYNTEVVVSQQDQNHILIENLCDLPVETLLQIDIMTLKNPSYSKLLNNQYTAQILNEFGNVQEEQNYTIPTLLQCLIDHCSECDGEFCLQCKDGLLLNENQCIQSCPQGYAESVNNICIKCQTNDQCLHCDSNNPQMCLVCNTGYEVLDGRCRQFQLSEKEKQQLLQQMLNDTLKNMTSNQTQNSNNSVLSNVTKPVVFQGGSSNNDDNFIQTLQEQPYLSFYCLLVGLFVLQKRICYKDVHISSCFLMYFGNVEMFCQCILVGYYSLYEEKVYIALISFSILFTLCNQVIIALSINTKTDTDSRFYTMYKDNRTMKFYRVLYTYLNFKFFSVYSSKYTPELQISNIQFQNKPQVLKVFKKGIKAAIINTLYILIVQLVYAFNSQFEKVEPFSFMIEYPVFCALFMSLLIQQISHINKQIRSLDNQNQDNPLRNNDNNNNNNNNQNNHNQNRIFSEQALNSVQQQRNNNNNSSGSGSDENQIVSQNQIQTQENIEIKNKKNSLTLEEATLSPSNNSLLISSSKLASINNSQHSLIKNPRLSSNPISPKKRNGKLRRGSLLSRSRLNSSHRLINMDNQSMISQSRDQISIVDHEAINQVPEDDNLIVDQQKELNSTQENAFPSPKKHSMEFQSLKIDFKDIEQQPKKEDTNRKQRTFRSLTKVPTKQNV